MQVVRFWGAQCMHHTRPNETERTRVSVDFRVVPRSCFDEGGCVGGRADPYRPGEFYGWMDANGQMLMAVGGGGGGLRNESDVVVNEDDVLCDRAASGEWLASDWKRICEPLSDAC